MATTDAKGRFKFTVSPGNYVLGFNTFWPPSEKLPYAPIYYPSADSPNGAAAIEVDDKGRVSNITFRLPRSLAVRTIPVLVTWPDGRSVENANVWLSEKHKPWSVVGTSVSHTQFEGKFDLKGLEGLDYILFADKYSGLGKVSCAEPVVLTASNSAPARITLVLNVNDFDACQASRHNVPSKKLE